MAIYYIKEGGNDALDGLSDANAWGLTGKITSGTFSAGDRIRVKCNGVYQNFTIPSSGSSGNPIVIESYGTGAKPICYGAIFASGWNDEGGNIHSFSHALMTQDPKMVRFDGALRERGKSNYFTITAASGTESWVEATGLPTFTYTGVQIVTRNRRFVYRVSGDVSKSSNRLTYGSDMPDLGLYNCIAGYGFFLQNHLSYLTSDGDWMYDSATDIFYMYFADDDPNAHEVLIATEDHVIDCAGRDYVNIDGLALIGSISHGINRDDNDYVNINNCEVAFCGDDGICNPDFTSTYCLVTNSIVHDCHSTGIYANFACHHMEATNNWVYNCGLNAGASLLYGNSDSRGLGICLQLGTGNKANLNRVTNIGFNGISVNGNSFEIEDNRIDTYNILKDDGAGIYVNLGGTATQLTLSGSVRRNICVNGVGNNIGANDPAVVVFGCYADDTQNLVEIEHNLLAFNAGAGLYLHNTEEITVRYNTIFGNARALNLSQDNGMTIRNTIFKFNKIYQNDPDQFLVSCFSEVSGDIDLFGDFDENEYHYVENHLGLFEVYGGDKYNYGLSFDEWKAIIAGEALSTCVPFQNHVPDSYTPAASLWSQTYPSDGSQSGSSPGQFSYFPGGTRTWSSGKAVITKTSGGKQDAYMAIGAIAATTKYVFTVQVDSSAGQHVSLIPESSFATSLKRKRIQAPSTPQTYKILFDNLNADASDQMLWLLESDFGSVNVDNVALEQLTDFDFESDINLIYNSGTEEEEFTFASNMKNLETGIVALSFTLDPGEFAVLQKTTEPITPVDPGEDVVIKVFAKLMIV